MDQSPEIRKRKVRDLAEKLGSTVQITELRIANLKADLTTITEDKLLDTLLEMSPESLQRAG